MRELTLNEMVDSIMQGSDSDLDYMERGMTNIVEDEEQILREVARQGWDEYSDDSEGLY